MTAWIISSGVLIAAVAAVRALFGKRLSASARYALWLLVLLRLVIPGSFMESRASVMNLAPAAVGGEGYIPPISDGANAPAIVPDYGEAPATHIEPAADIEAGSAEAPSAPVWGYPWYVTVWAAGSILTAAALAASNTAFYLRLRRSRRRVQADCPLPVYISGVTASPCLFGFFRPAVYLTPGAAEGEKLPYVLAHELAHRRHGDNWWSLCRCLCLALWWWEPLVWLAAVLSRRDGEICCDEAAIRALGEEKRLGYCRTLVDMIAPRPTALGLLNASTAMAAGPRGMRARLESIVKKPRIRASAVIAAALLVLLAAGCTFTGAKEAENSEAPAVDETTAPEGAEMYSSYSGPCEGRLDGDVIELSGPDGGFIMAVPSEVWAGLEWVVDMESRDSLGPFFCGCGETFRWVVSSTYPAAGLVAVRVGLYTDAGGEWSVSSPPVRHSVTGAAFADRDRGYICSIPWDDSGPVIYETTDGGGSWARLVVTIPADLAGYKLTARTPSLRDDGGVDFPVDVYSDELGLLGTVEYSVSGEVRSWSALEAVSAELIYNPGEIANLPGYGTNKLLRYYLSGDGAYTEGAMAELRSRFVRDTEATLAAISALGGEEADQLCLGLGYAAFEYGIPEAYARDYGVALGGEPGRYAQRIKEYYEERTGTKLQFHLGPSDVDGDGADEYVYVEETGEGEYTVQVRGADSTLLWSHELGLAHAGWAQVYVTTDADGGGHILLYTPGVYQGEADYAYRLIDFIGMKEHVSAENSVSFPADEAVPEDFADEVNALIARSVLVAATTDGVFSGPART